MKVDTSVLKQRSDELQKIQRKLNKISSQINQVNEQLGWNVSISSSVRKSLLQYSEVVLRISDMTGRLDAVLCQASDYYQKTELSIQRLSSDSKKNDENSDDGYRRIDKPIYMHGLVKNDLPFVLMNNWTDTFDFLKDFGNLEEVFNWGGEFGDTFNEYIGDINELELIKGWGYFKDGAELIDAINNKDAEAVTELMDKYVKGGCKELIKKGAGAGGFEATVYLNMAWSTIENINEGFDIVDESIRQGNSWRGILDATVNVVQSPLEGCIDTGYDYVKSFGDVVGWDVDAEYKTLTGATGAEGVYNALGEMVDFTKDFGFGGLVGALGDSVSTWGRGISDFFSGK